MIHILLMSSVLAAPTFNPVPADVTVDGYPLSGILVDEETFSELGRLRTEVRAKEKELEAFTEWKASNDKIVRESLEAIRAQEEASRSDLIEHYETALERAGRRDALQKHGFPLGIAVGVVGSTILTVAVLNVYATTLPTSLTGG